MCGVGFDFCDGGFFVLFGVGFVCGGFFCPLSFSGLRQYQVFTNKNSASSLSFAPALLPHLVLLSLSFNSGFGLLWHPRHCTNLMPAVNCRIDVVKWERIFKKRIKLEKCFEHKTQVVGCFQTHVKYMLSILLVLQLLCSIMIHCFKWQNFLVSCLSSELFTVVIDLNIHCLLLFFLPVLMPVNCNNNFSTHLLSRNYSASFFLPR